MDTSTHLTEQFAEEEAYKPQAVAASGVPSIIESNELTRELGMWLRALPSFFQVRNQPFSESDHAAVATRDWTNEARIVRLVLLRISQLTLSLVSEKRVESLGEDVEDGASLNLLLSAGEQSKAFDESTNRSLVALAEALGDVLAVCDALLEGRRFSFYAWSSLGKILARELTRFDDTLKALSRVAHHHAAANLQAPLIELVKGPNLPGALGTDVLMIFSDLARLLDRLRFIETLLRRDQPLKGALLVFTLVYEEARALVQFIETRALRTEGLDESVFDTLDGTNYAISMELRKVFAHELLGLSGLRQAPPIYAKVENAHGLLRDCFQQSTVGLAQLFDPSLDGARLFSAFQTKLEQSLALRRDLWTLLQLVRRAEKERDLRPVQPLLERLASFREGSLRYLMYKDWEACERFMEEVAAARGAVELTPVLHRFGAYLETLHGQVNMRAVLANHPFDFPQLNEQ